jgi:hypothetical protein
VHVAPGTVWKVLDEADFDQQIQESRSNCAGLFPLAEEGLKKALRCSKRRATPRHQYFAETSVSNRSKTGLLRRCEPQTDSLDFDVRSDILQAPYFPAALENVRVGLCLRIIPN